MFLIVRCGGAAVYAPPSTGIHATNSSASDWDASAFYIKTAKEKRKYNVESDSHFVYVQRVKYGHYAHKIIYACDPVGSLNVGSLITSIEARLPTHYNKRTKIKATLEDMSLLILNGDMGRREVSIDAKISLSYEFNVWWDCNYEKRRRMGLKQMELNEASIED
ncbi:hypothetical protein M9H77_07936 [Catharanthus roseus]|uniref:Uncharacterized protein n=1 Tax=Catharanthus roseus TaxID=4058 RepID=A0ACC0BWH7_CATRO|nr:hypothetical protein M9H77_07936 [Catharanthus roseus]